MMKQDRRDIVKTIGKNENEEFNAVKTFFGFERKCHFVIALTIFNLVSLYVAQTECSGNLLNSTWLTFTEVVLLTIFLVLFLLKIANRTFQPQAVNAADRWVTMAIGTFGVVVVTEIVLHFVPSIVGITCGLTAGHHSAHM
jgi:hypothetical protein